MASPYKMKGHSLPGPNQKKSPMKEPITLALIGLGTAALGAGTSSIQGAKNRKTANKNQKEQEAADAKSNAIAGISKKIGSSTKII